MPRIRWVPWEIRAKCIASLSLFYSVKKRKKYFSYLLHLALDFRNDCVKNSCHVYIYCFISVFSLPVNIVRKTRFLSGFGFVDLIYSVATFQNCNSFSFAANAWRQSTFVYEGCKCCQIRRLVSRKEGETHEYLTKESCLYKRKHLPQILY